MGVVAAGVGRVGVVLVNINPAYRTAELEHALRLAGVHALFLIPSFRTSDYVAMLLELCDEARSHAPGELACRRLPSLRTVVCWDPDQAELSTRVAEGFHTWQEVLAAGEAVGSDEVARRGQALDPDDPINIQFTSGTTGFPKAVVLTHHNILNNGYLVAEQMRLTERDRLCVPVPFYHCFGMVVSNLACLSHGACVVIPAPHFEPGATLRAIEQERCTAVHGVPTMFVAELEQLREKNYDLSSLRTGIMAGAPCPPEIVRRVMEDLHCPEILIGYGQTEASPVTHATKPHDSFERRVETALRAARRRPASGRLFGLAADRQVTDAQRAVVVEAADERAQELDERNEGQRERRSPAAQAHASVVLSVARGDRAQKPVREQGAKCVCHVATLLDPLDDKPVPLEQRADPARRVAVVVVRKLMQRGGKRHRHERAPTGPQNARKLGDHPIGIGNVLEHLHRQHRVERAFRERQSVAIAPDVDDATNPIEVFPDLRVQVVDDDRVLEPDVAVDMRRELRLVGPFGDSNVEEPTRSQRSKTRGSGAQEPHLDPVRVQRRALAPRVEALREGFAVKDDALVDRPAARDVRVGRR